MQETQAGSLGWEDPLEEEKWQPAPVFLPGEFHGQRSLVGYSPRGCKQSDTTEQLTLSFTLDPCEAKSDVCGNSNNIYSRSTFPNLALRWLLAHSIPLLRVWPLGISVYRTQSWILCWEADSFESQHDFLLHTFLCFRDTSAWRHRARVESRSYGGMTAVCLSPCQHSCPPLPSSQGGSYS